MPEPREPNCPTRPDPEPGGALAATTRIQNRHYKVQWIEPNNLGADDSCSHGGDGEWNLHPWPCPDHADAGVVAERLHEAIQYLEAIRDITSQRRVPWERVLSEHAAAALDALRGSS